MSPEITQDPCADPSEVAGMRDAHLRSLIAPMDGMWESFANAATHTRINADGEQAGYYVLNDEGILLQLYIDPAFQRYSRVLFDRVIAQASVRQAMAGTIDPAFLSLCLDVHKSVTVHTLLYEHDGEVHAETVRDNGLTFRLIDSSELDRTVALQLACLGAGAELGQWLRGYSANLIDRKELFVLCRDDDWLGLGECRKSDSQDRVADLGMMVTPDHRGRGLATDILNRLFAISTHAGLRPICSTTVDNTNAQRAIVRAGFVSRHRLLSVTF